MAKNTICVWYDKDAEAAARFYAETFPDSAVGAIWRAPGDYPSGKKGDVLVVEFKVAGVSCVGLNGGPQFKHTEAFSFQIATDDQAETDRYWNAIVGNGGQESACGWCKDKWGVSWQITPRVLTEAMAAGGDKAKPRPGLRSPWCRAKAFVDQATAPLTGISALCTSEVSLVASAVAPDHDQLAVHSVSDCTHV
jgi:predicted 3-demethylubiquinone-9 3-methyltransferase (glyoxalase superfamily)